MPLYGLFIKISESENVAYLEPASGRRWGLKLQCTSCNERTENFVFVDESEEVEVDGGTANAVVSCKFCRKQMTLTVDPRHYGRYDMGPVPQKIAAFDVRGGEPVELLLEDKWIATATGDAEKTFDEGVELNDDWVGYDDKGDQSVSIMGVDCIFQRLSSGK